MKTTKRALTATVLLSCACLMAPYYAHAEEHEEGELVGTHTPNYIELSVNGQNFAKFDLYDLNNDRDGYYDEYNTRTDFRNFFTTETHATNEKDAIEKSMKYIVDIVGAPANTLNMNLKLCSPEDANASAKSPTWIQLDANGKPIQISDSELTATYLGKMPYNKDNGVAEITVNEANKWYVKKFPVLPSNGFNSDYYGTITHEMFHALGLGTYIDKDKETDDIVFGTKAEYKKTNGTTVSMDVFNKYEMGIRDVFNRVVYYSGDAENGYVTYDNKPIDPNDSTDWNRINGELKSRKIILITLADFEGKYSNEANRKPDEFYVLSDYIPNDNSPTEHESGNSSLRLNNTNQGETTSDIGTNGGAYFTGKNVNKVLTTYNSKTNKDELALIAWPDDSEVKAVPGLPLNGYESDPEQERSGDYPAIPELSHIELQNSLMSHQNYRNWCTYMEAEIALLQDLGYTIDRSKYFGKSIYNSGVKKEDDSIDYFTYVNNNGFNSDQMHGIGLHVYGSYVDVTQKADINAAGDYGIGIRVDGVGNKVTIDSNISANGEGGNGLLVAYGKKHEVTLNAGKTIEATDTDGVAARFDFGSNELSDEAEYRGSYFSVSYEKAETPASGTGSGDAASRFQDSTSSSGQETQYQWEQKTTPEAINGELVTNFNVSGTLKGQQAAIYISENALVKNINILSGADIQGDIISKWNPKEIIIYNDDSENSTVNTGLAPELDGKNGYTNLTFGGKYIEPANEDVPNAEGSYGAVDSSFNLSYGGDILGADSIEMRIAGGTLNYSGNAEILNVTINKDAILGGTGTYTLSKITADTPVASTLDSSDGYTVTRGTFTNNGTFNLGDGIKEITITGNYKQSSTGNLGVDFNSDQQADKLIVNEGYAALDGTISLTPQVDYYFNRQKITIDVLDGTSISNSIIDSGNEVNVKFNNISPVLKFSLNTDETTQNTVNQGKYVINVSRVDQGYQSVADDKISTGIGSALDSDAKQNTEKVYVGADKLKLIQAIDFPLTTTNTDAERKKVMNTNIKKLNPNVVGSQAQAVLETHTTLNNLVSVTSLVNAGSMSMNAPVAVKRGGLGPTKVEPPKYNSWRNIVIPFAAYTNQHNGSNGYTNHNSGVIGAMERTFANGLTHGYHAAINHQSTEDSGSTIKGEGLYLGTHASYAPEEWNGWSVFGSARLGVEQMRSHRRVYIPSAVPYIGTADGDWTGYSGSFNIGAALTKEHGVMRSGPFAALDYSFAHRPSVHEDGGAVRTNLESATYDSLRTQLGYRLVTNPKPLHSYDSTQWQAHASVAWNHELLSDNGRTNYQLVEFPGATVEDDIETYGRDSMSIAAGVIFKTPNRLDVGLTLGSDIYRKGGSSVYGKVNFEWKF